MALMAQWSILGKEAFKEWLVYGALYMENRGPYHRSNRKYILEKVTPERPVDRTCFLDGLQFAAVR